jgi:ribosome-associated protein
MINDIKINSEFIKLGNLLKFTGEVATGGESKELIAAGKINVNGEICTMRGKKIKNGDIVEINNKSFKIISTK